MDALITIIAVISLICFVAGFAVAISDFTDWFS